MVYLKETLKGKEKVTAGSEQRELIALEEEEEGGGGGGATTTTSAATATAATAAKATAAKAAVFMLRGIVALELVSLLALAYFLKQDKYF